MKVLHLPTSVGGNSWGLSLAERTIGIESEVLIANNNSFSYKNDICLNLENKNKISQLLKRIETFLDVRNKYDVFHFNYGSTLIDNMRYNINLLDLPYYNGKKIMTYNGSDARQNLNLLLNKYVGELYELEPYNIEKRNNILKKRIEKVYKHVDHIFSLNPDLMYFLPKDKTTFLPYTIAGWNEIKSIEYKIEKKLKIVHSPTNRLIKGSRYILEALKKIKNKNNNIEIEIIEGLPYHVALSKYQEADIIIDQLLAGWYGAFGVEVMKMGKPLAVFIREEDLHFIPNEMAKDLLDVVINISKDNIEEVLLYYLDNTQLLFEKSKAGLEYVYKWHNPTHIARLTKNIYTTLGE